MGYMISPGLKTRSIRKIQADKIDEIFALEFYRVCQAFNQQPIEVKADDSKRKREFVEVRMVSMLLFKCKYKVSLATAGNYFNKDHATVLHAAKTVVRLRDTDKQFRKITKPLFDGVSLKEYEDKYL